MGLVSFMCVQSYRNNLNNQTNCCIKYVVLLWTITLQNRPDQSCCQLAYRLNKFHVQESWYCEYFQRLPMKINNKKLGEKPCLFLANNGDFWESQTFGKVSSGQLKQKDLQISTWVMDWHVQLFVIVWHWICGLGRDWWIGNLW